jgi:hypothetical protein
MIVFGTISGWSQDNSPLTPDEGRQILGQLLELNSCRNETKEYEAFIEREKDQDAREKELYDKELKLWGDRLELKQKELDLETEKKEFYKDMYDELTRKKGVKCFFKKLFTLWRSSC